MNDAFIDYEYKGSKKRKPMRREERAAQFQSFDALSGHKEEIAEESRLTNELIKLAKDKESEIEENLKQLLKDNSKKALFVYFEKDGRKSGGSYKNMISSIRKIDSLKKTIRLESEVCITLDNLIDVQILNEAE